MQGRHEENPCRRLEAKTRNSVNRHVSPRSTTLFAMDLQSQALACSFEIETRASGMYMLLLAAELYNGGEHACILLIVSVSMSI